MGRAPAQSPNHEKAPHGREKAVASAAFIVISLGRLVGRQCPLISLREEASISLAGLSGGSLGSLQAVGPPQTLGLPSHALYWVLHTRGGTRRSHHRKGGCKGRKPAAPIRG